MGFVAARTQQMLATSIGVNRTELTGVHAGAARASDDEDNEW